MLGRSAISEIIRPAAAAAAAGLAVATAITGCQSATTARHSASAQNLQYRYYRSMMGRYHGGSMMGGGPGSWMMSGAGYRWMTGAGAGIPSWMTGAGAGIPGWMHGGRLPGYMMSQSADAGTVMGRFWANGPGPRVSPAQATRLGEQIPAGAQVSRSANTITFTTARVRLAVLASPAGGPDETYRIAGLVNPKLVVPRGARVSIELINADPDTAHGLVITASGAARSPMPMMTARPTFAGSALWFLGNPTSAGMHAGTLTFTASTPGTYRYLCAVPGHARKGMTGTLIVASSG